MSPNTSEEIFEDEGDHSEASSTAEHHHPDINEVSVSQSSRILFVPRIVAILLFLIAGAGIAAGMHVLIVGENEDRFESQVGFIEVVMIVCR